MGMPKYSQFKFEFYSDHFKVYTAVFLPSVGYLYLSVAEQFIFNREKQSFSHISADNTWSKPVPPYFFFLKPHPGYSSPLSVRLR